jgi:hypothetical protein
MTRATPKPVTEPTAEDNCLGRTCLKWQPDGELSALDIELVMQRLRRVDAQVCAMLDPADAA